MTAAQSIDARAATKPDCRDCLLAARRRWWGFAADCDPCKARAVTRLPQFKEARDRGDWYWQPYLRLLDQLRLTHDAVRAAAAKDKVSQ